MLHFIKYKVYKKAIFFKDNTLYKYEREKQDQERKPQTTKRNSPPH